MVKKEKKKVSVFEQVGYKSGEKSYNSCIEGSIGTSIMLFNNCIWGIDEVCSFTSYARGTIYNLVSRGEIPYRKRGSGRRLVFIPSEITEWFKGEL